MSLDHCEGWDEWGLTQAEAQARGWNTTAASPSQPTGRFSGFGYRWPNNSQTTHLFKVAGTRQTIGFAWRTPNASTSLTIFEFMEGGTVHGRVAYNGNGTFTVSRAGTTFGATPTSTNQGILSNTWYYLELDYFCDDTNGTYALRLNGNTSAICSGTGDSKNGGTGSMDTLRISQPNALATDWDDYYEASGSTSFQGDCAVKTDVPNADGTYTAWTASAGSDYQCVDEIPYNSDTDYISATAASTDDTFGFPSTGLAGTVLMVETAAIARRDDAAVRQIALLVDSGGVNAGASQTVNASYAMYYRADLTDPGTGSAWTMSGVNAAQYGVRNV